MLSRDKLWDALEGLKQNPDAATASVFSRDHETQAANVGYCVLLRYNAQADCFEVCLPKPAIGWGSFVETKSIDVVDLMSLQDMQNEFGVNVRQCFVVSEEEFQNSKVLRFPAGDFDRLFDFHSLVNERADVRVLEYFAAKTANEFNKVHQTELVVAAAQLPDPANG